MFLRALRSWSYILIMMAVNNIDIALTGTGLGLVGLATAHALVAAINQLRKRTPKDNFYEDVDGKSTPESIAAFSNRLPKLFILAFSVTGFGTSTAISVLSSLHTPSGDLFLKNWLIAGAWVSGLKPQAFSSETDDFPQIGSDCSACHFIECPPLTCKGPRPWTLALGLFNCCCGYYCTPVKQRSPACFARGLRDSCTSCCECRRCPLSRLLQRIASTPT